MYVLTYQHVITVVVLLKIPLFYQPTPKIEHIYKVEVIFKYQNSSKLVCSKYTRNIQNHDCHKFTTFPKGGNKLK